MTFLLATKNLKKLAELQRILAPLGITVICDRDLEAPLDDVEETGSTFEENAFLKADAACRATGMPCVADDSGLCVDALGGEPGIYSARYSGVHGNDSENIDKLLGRLSVVPEPERTARFVSAVCCVFPDGRSFTVRGECEGRIAFERHGNGGFGYDPVFIYADGRCFGELTPEEKDKVSHRGKALRALAQRLPEYIG